MLKQATYTHVTDPEMIQLLPVQLSLKSAKQPCSTAKKKKRKETFIVWHRCFAISLSEFQSSYFNFQSDSSLIFNSCLFNTVLNSLYFPDRNLFSVYPPSNLPLPSAVSIVLPLMWMHFICPTFVFALNTVQLDKPKPLIC